MNSKIVLSVISALALAVPIVSTFRCAVGDNLHGSFHEAEEGQSCVVYEKECVATGGEVTCIEQSDIDRGFKVVAAILDDLECGMLSQVENDDIHKVKCCKDELCNDPLDNGYSTLPGMPEAEEKDASGAAADTSGASGDNKTGTAAATLDGKGDKKLDEKKSGNSTADGVASSAAFMKPDTLTTVGTVVAALALLS